MYGINRTTHTPTPVVNSVYCHFYNRDEPRNLVTSGANQLKIYRLVRVPSSSTSACALQNTFIKQIDFGGSGEEYSPDYDVKLECMQTFSLNGNIESLNVVSFVETARDCLLLAFSEAKLSLVEYDPDTHDLKTISMHYFEDDDMKQGYYYNVKPPLVRVDPENRCAAMLIYTNNIIIIPFRKDVVEADQDDDDQVEAESNPHEPSLANISSSNRRNPVLPSYRLDLKNQQYGANIVNILDIQFLHNYYEPTLLILYEPIRTWSGRVALRQDTVSMITLSLDVYQRVHPHIWSLTNLPFDTFAALAVPKPLGGVLILANNALIHFNHGFPPYGMSLNCFNDSVTSFPLKRQNDVKISLDCAQTCLISNNKIVLSLNTGEIYLLHLHNDTTRSIRTMDFTLLASSIYATTLTKCEDGYLFIGSRLAHSVLLYYELRLQEDEDLGKRPARTAHFNRLTAQLDFDESKQTEDEYLYGEEAVYLFPKHPKLVDETEEMQIAQPLVNGDIAMVNGDMTNQENDNNNNIDEEEEMVVEVDETKAIKLLNGDEGISIEEQEELEIEKQREADEIEDREEEEFAQKIRLLEVVKSEHFHLRLCDALYNIGPCGQMSLGESLSTPSLDSLSRASEHFNVELVTTCGFRKSGGLTVLQRTIKPSIETSFKLPDCLDLFTVFGPEEAVVELEVEGSEQQQARHKYLILSQSNSTIVFESGQEINELEDSDFITDSPTILASNLGNSKYILQVTPTCACLLDGPQQMHQYPPSERPLSAPIVHSSTADPYTALLTENGQVVLLCLRMDAKKGMARLVASQPDLVTDRAKITALCLYRDVSGLFCTENKTDNPDKTSNQRKGKRKKTSTKKKINFRPMTTATLSTNLTNATIEEEELLYGSSTVSFLKTDELDEPQEAEPEPDGEEIDKLRMLKRAEPSFWMFVVRENGVLEVYKLPDFKLVYLVKNFAMGNKVLVDSVQSTEHSYDTLLTMPVTREIVVVGMAAHQGRPHLFARLDDELLIYELFPFFELQVDNHLKIRFKKTTIPQGLQLEAAQDKEEPSNRKWLRPFTNISGYSGLFLCGAKPRWFVMSARGELAVHPMDADGAIASFAVFNNISIVNGFIYYNQQDELRFAVLPTKLELDAQWPFKHVPLGKTVHYVSYHLESKTYALVTSRQADIHKIVRVGGEEKEFELIERFNDPRYIPAKMNMFQMQLLSPLEWKLIPGTRLRLDEWEHVTCVKNILLTSQGTSSGLKGYIVLGTNYAYGEDVTNRGRIWIVDIIEVVPEPGKPLTKNKMKLIYCKDQKGPVTALCQVKGYLLTAIGQKIYIWQLKEEKDLNGIAFIDTQIYVNSAVSLRNLILIGDVYKSITLLRYQEETRTLSLVARDHRPLQVYDCQFFIDGSQVCFIVSDVERNIFLYTYQPDAAESMGGTKLLRRGEFQLGWHINAFYRIRCRVPPAKTTASLEEKQSFLRRHATLYATLDGSLGHVLPVGEKIFRRLSMLQNLMVTNVQHHAGLNPRAFRALRATKLELMNPNKTILDGDLIFRFLSLSQNERAELAKKIGTTPKQVIQDLQDIETMTLHF